MGPDCMGVIEGLTDILSEVTPQLSPIPLLVVLVGFRNVLLMPRRSYFGRCLLFFFNFHILDN